MKTNKESEYSVTLRSRCKHTVFLKKHKCVEFPNGLGFRCKYCNIPYVVLRGREMKKWCRIDIGKR